MIKLVNSKIMHSKKIKLVRNNPFIMELLISKENYALDNNLIAENINDALKAGFTIDKSTPEVLRNNPNVIKACVEKDPKSIEYALLGSLTEENINLALAKGYMLSKTSPLHLKDNPKIVEESVKRDVNLINYVHEAAVTDELLEFVVQSDYIVSISSPAFLRRNPSIIAKSIRKNAKFINVALDGALTKENIYYALEHGFKLDVNCSIPLAESDIMKKYILDNLVDKNDQYIVNLIELYGVYGYIGYENGILKPYVMKEFGENGQTKIFKYMFLSKKLENTKIFTSERDLPFLRYLYSYISGDITFDEKFDVVLFESIQKKYDEYKELSKRVIQSEDKKAIANLIELYSNKYISQNSMNISSVSDLSNLDFKINESKKNAINNSNNLEKIQNIIILSLFNMNLKEFKSLLKEDINSLKCDHLLDSISDEQTRNKISKVRTILLFAEKIILCEDMELLRQIGNQIINNDIKYTNLFKNIKDIAKSFYVQDINENVTHIDSLSENNENIKIFDNKYFSSEVAIGKNSGEIILGRKPVRLIEINKEATFFAHVTNAVGSKGKITDWKHPRLVGSTHLCLSAITNNTETITNGVDNIDSHVILLFDKIKEGALIAFNNDDICSNTYNNDYNITIFEYNMDTLSKTLKNTTGYNEYVVYRENNDGTSFYPSGVMVQGDEPVQAEIDAAAYLEVPLIKLSKEIKKNKAINIEENKRIEEQVSSKDCITELISIIKNLQTTSVQTLKSFNIIDARIKQKRIDGEK